MSTLSEEFLLDYINEQNLTNSNEVLEEMKNMIKTILQVALEVEINLHLCHDNHNPIVKHMKNKINRYFIKTINTDLGPVKITIPCDKNSDFRPRIVPQYKSYINFGDIIMTLYATGITYNDIKIQIKNMYNVEVSNNIVSNITNRVINVVSAWQNRPLQNSYFFVFIDSIELKMYEESKVVMKKAYIAIGVNMDKRTEILGL